MPLRVLNQTFEALQSLRRGDPVVHSVSFDGFEAGAVDHFDDLLFGHFYFAAGFDRVAVGEFAAVEINGAEGAVWAVALSSTKSGIINPRYLQTAHDRSLPSSQKPFTIAFHPDVCETANDCLSGVR